MVIPRVQGAAVGFGADGFDAGVGVRKEDAGLKAKIDAALTELTASGTIAKALDHYGVPYFPPK